AIGPVADLH
nr:RecName: Full=Laccase-1b; AltName: Full=Benzenediol:oxygen oxidoreductase 1b; AltName: Full=Diphenol oxidase 1b; AltName: Full=Lac Ib; AltName: Full=Urishiol oxidase 1b [Cerrena unicolor]